MPDIYHDFPISASVASVFSAVTEPEGLDSWWTKRSSGRPAIGETYHLHFGSGYDWQARVTAYSPGESIEWEMTSADDEWAGSKIGFRLTPKEDRTDVHFYHRGWPQNSDHYRVSCYCWAMYLRILKRYVEHGERVPYDQRLKV